MDSSQLILFSAIVLLRTNYLKLDVVTELLRNEYFNTDNHKKVSNLGRSNIGFHCLLKSNQDLNISPQNWFENSILTIV